MKLIIVKQIHICLQVGRPGFESLQSMVLMKIQLVFAAKLKQRILGIFLTAVNSSERVKLLHISHALKI